MNKKGKGQGLMTAALISVIAVALILGVFGWRSGLFTQNTALTPSEQAAAVATAANQNSVATLKVLVNDKATDSFPQVATTSYIMEQLGDKFTGTQSIATSATAGTRSNLASTVGTHVKAISFDGTYYGGRLGANDAWQYFDEFDVSKEVQTYDQLGWRIMTTDGQFRYGDTDATILDTDSDGNITLGANGADSISIRWRNNETDRVYLLKGVVFDTTNTTSQISKIELRLGGSSGVDVSGVTVSRCALTPFQLRNTADYCFEFSRPLVVEENEYVTLESSWLATSQNPNEQWNTYLFDNSCYQATQTKDGHVANEIVCGAVQSDAITPADVGGAFLNATSSGSNSIMIG